MFPLLLLGVKQGLQAQPLKCHRGEMLSPAQYFRAVRPQPYAQLKVLLLYTLKAEPAALHMGL